MATITYLLTGRSEPNYCTGEHMYTCTQKIAHTCFWQTLSASHCWVADSPATERTDAHNAPNYRDFIFCIEKPPLSIIQESCLLGKEEKASSGKWCDTADQRRTRQWTKTVHLTWIWIPPICRSMAFTVIQVIISARLHTTCSARPSRGSQAASTFTCLQNRVHSACWLSWGLSLHGVCPVSL